MTTTVYFATNRVVNGPSDSIGSYSSTSTASDRPQDITYGTAFVQTNAKAQGQGKDVTQANALLAGLHAARGR